MDQTFSISGEYIELIKLLKASGLCSTGGQTKMLVEDEKIMVDGKIETRKRMKLRQGMVVQYDSHSIKLL